MKYIFLSLMCITFIQFAHGQTFDYRQYDISKKADSSSIYLYYNIDTIQGDTLKYLKSSNLFIRVSKDGIILFQGHKQNGGFVTSCGCSNSIAHGYATERYRTGELKEQGQYYCGYKIGLWHYFYKNGNIKKIEMLSKAYDHFFENEPFKIQNRQIYSNGSYQEYYPKGQLKVDGQYKIHLRKRTSKEVAEINPETYETYFIQVKGEFWEPVSIKFGQWTYFKEDGSLMKIINHDISSKSNLNLKTMDEGCWDLIFLNFNFK